MNFLSSKLVCAPCIRKYKIRRSRKTVFANDIERVYRIM